MNGILTAVAFPENSLVKSHRKPRKKASAMEMASRNTNRERELPGNAGTHTLESPKSIKKTFSSEESKKNPKQ